LPDIVGNIRVDQSWGSWQIAGALHDASGGYYGTTESTGHPGNTWGYAVMSGLRINTPFIAAGDYFVISGAYTVGAAQYAASSNYKGRLIWNGSQAAFGFLTDGVYGNSATTTPNSVELTTAWSVAAAYEHFWTPNLHTALYGSYLSLSHNDTAKTLICSSTNTFNWNGSSSSAGLCNPNWAQSVVGARTQWDITKSLYMGLDVVYTRLNSASVNSSAGTFVLSTAANGKGVNTYTVADQSAWMGTFRIHRDIVP
jgi:hypothetical protein